MKVLLLNPPADEVVIRDYYCSKTSKSNYLFQPIDLVMQSGILSTDHDVFVLDAVAGRLDPRKTRQKIMALAPDIILGLVGAVRHKKDLAFYKDLMSRTRARLFLSGDIVLEGGEALLSAHPYIEGLLLRFISHGLLHYLRGEKFDGLLVNTADGIQGELTQSRSKEYSVPRPRHELFDLSAYRFSFARGRRFATVLTDFGCPYQCSFCVMPGLGYCLRPVDEVVDELKYLSGLGIREYFFADQCFGASRSRSLRLCESMAAQLQASGFTTFTRPDLLDEDLADALKAAGGHTLIMGVESADPGILEHYRKQTSLDRVSRAIELCRAKGIRSVATFIIGLPEDTRESIRATMRLARELDPDFVSYNVAVPRQGTGLRQQAREKGILEEDAEMDQAGHTASMDTESLAKTELAALKREAVRNFYLRPAYLLKRLRTVSSLRELTSETREGLALIRRNL